MSALGIIEFIGIVPAITAGDAAAKAANIEIIGFEMADGGLVAVKMRGSVSAVEAALYAAEEAGRPLGTFVGKTLIARPSEDTVQAFESETEEEAKMVSAPEKTESAAASSAQQKTINLSKASSQREVREA